MDFEKLRQRLLNNGFTPEEIDSIVKIMFECDL